MLERAVRELSVFAQVETTLTAENAEIAESL